jgi:hypothetical protein
MRYGGGGTDDAGEAVEEGRLAGAVRTDHGADLTAGHGHGDVVEGGEASEPNG